MIDVWVTYNMTGAILRQRVADCDAHLRLAQSKLLQEHELIPAARQF